MANAEYTGRTPQELGVGVMINVTDTLVFRRALLGGGLLFQYLLCRCLSSANSCARVRYMSL